MFKSLKLLFNKKNKDIRKRILFTLGCLFVFIIFTLFFLATTPLELHIILKYNLAPNKINNINGIIFIILIAI